ncbi:MAG TPA: TonB family protein [Noviherbaspirillum sp.]|nr:TonB family protein [Noviherbaspirillum sp.]
MTAKTAERANSTTAPTGPYRVRLAGAMAVSLLIHGLIISMQFGVPGIGLPTLEMPWRERRAQAVDLNVVLANPAPAPAAPEASAEPPAPPPVPAEAPRTGLRLVPLPKTAKAPAKEKPASKRKKEKPVAAARPPRARAKRETPVIALNEARENSFNVPAPALDEILTPPEPETAAPPVALPVPADAAPADDPAEQDRELAAQKLAEEENAQRQREAEEREARLQAEQQRIESVRRQEEEVARERALALEAQRAEEAKQREEVEKAAEQEAQRLAREREERRQAEEAARREAAALALQMQQDEILRREREEATRRALELEERQRAEALRLQAEQLQRAQREAMELQAHKQAEAAAEAARQQAAAREREKQVEATSTAKRERDPELLLGDSPGANERIGALPRKLTGGGLAGQALEQARRGDMLQGDASRTAPPSARQSDSNMDTPRRRSIFGSKDVDVGVMMYVESWRLKVERNGSINYPRASVDKAHGDPVVTVAIRSDGSVEDVVIHRSSGRPELDEAVLRIVRINARYSTFPPELARRFDVIEIRRVWNFDSRLRILEEVR